MPLVLVVLFSLVVLLLYYCCSYVSAISIFSTHISVLIITYSIIAEERLSADDSLKERTSIPTPQLN